jgi:oligopeptide transport system substrate-binding protein
MSRKIWFVVSLLVVASMALTACQPPQVQTVITVVPAATVVNVVVATPVPAAPTPVPPKPAAPKVLRMATGASDVATIDPARSVDMTSIQIVEDTTVGLVRQNPANAQVELGMATKWDVSADGKVYTFKIRGDVPWVRWDGKKVAKVQTCPDKDGKTKDRLVTAKDFEYGILRTLDSKTAAEYAYVLTPVIVGGAEFNEGKITDTAKVGVKAIDDTTLQVTVKEAAAYNVNILGLWVAHAQPSWIIDGDDCTEGRGEKWTEPGFFQGYGAFVLKEWVHDSVLTVVKNPFWPGTDTVPVAKIDEIQRRVLDVGPAFAEFEAGNMDVTSVPLADSDRVLSDAKYKPMLSYVYNIGTEFYSFQTKRPPTDDVRVRQALSLAIDRESLVKNVNKGDGDVAAWYCNPGATGCPSPDKYPDLGVKYNPAKAKELMDAYLKEKGLTADKLEIVLMFNTSESHQKRAEAIQQMWKDALGVTVKLTNQERKVFYQQRDEGLQNIYRSSWVQDYPDANNFMKDVFGDPKASYALVVKWQNEKFLQLITDAARETDPTKRMAMYAEAEKILVVDDAVLAPLYWYRSAELVQPYVKHPKSITGYEQYEKWDIVK